MAVTSSWLGGFPCALGLVRACCILRLRASAERPRTLFANSTVPVPKKNNSPALANPAG